MESERNLYREENNELLVISHSLLLVDSTGNQGYIGRWAMCKHGGRAVLRDSVSHTDALSGASLNSNLGVGALGYR